MQEKMSKQDTEAIIEKLQQFGVFKTGIVAVKDIVFDPAFRKLCESNSCGKYGKCWTCPPDAGEINELIAQAKQFDEAVIYQTVGELEDSYDFEGMMAAGEVHNKITQKLQKVTAEMDVNPSLHLGAGGCKVCERCAKATNEPCRVPRLAIKSLETFGIDVSQLSRLAGMKYINGQNTVTYFGGFFYNK